VSIDSYLRETRAIAGVALLALVAGVVSDALASGRVPSPVAPCARGAACSRSGCTADDAIVPPIDASAVVHARSSSRRTPDPL